MKQINSVEFSVLKYNRVFMAPLGIYGYQLTKPTNEFFNSICTYYILSVTFFLLLISSAVYIYENSKHILTVLQAISIIIAGLQMGGMFVSTGYNMLTIKKLHLDLQEIVDTSEYLYICITESVSEMIFKSLFRQRQRARYLLENRAKMSQIHAKIMLLCNFPHANICSCTLSFHLLHT